MPDYRIRPDGFKEIRSQQQKRLLVIPLMIALFVIPTTIYNAKENTDFIITLPVTIILFTIIYYFAIRKALKKQKELLDSYALTINDNTIARYQLNTPTISLYHSEVKEILKTTNSGFIIKGNASEDIILVPPQIDNYDELEIRLNGIKTIHQHRSKNIFEKHPVIAIILMMGLMIGVYGSRNKFIVLFCGIPVVVMMIWSFLKIQKSKNVETRIKRNAWVILIVLISIVAVIIMNLAGNYSA